MDKFEDYLTRELKGWRDRRDAYVTRMGLNPTKGVIDSIPIAEMSPEMLLAMFEVQILEGILQAYKRMSR